MRSFLGLAISLLFVSGACSKVEVHRCENRDDCHDDAICTEGYCVFDPLPRLRVEASGDRAGVGEEIWLDASNSYVPERGGLELELSLSPEGVAEILPGGGEMNFGFRVVEPHTSVEAVLLGRSESGREAIWRTAIAPRNSPPLVDLHLPERMQPGERIRLEAAVEDPDGDPVWLEWRYEGVGEFLAESSEAFLDLPPEDDASPHRIEVVAHDGISSSRALVEFQAENAPPRIVELIGPGVVEHRCNETHCFAEAHFEVVAEDVGPLRYDWRFRGELQGEAIFEGADHSRSMLFLSVLRSRPIAGSYQVEVQVRDEKGALAAAVIEFSVGNRPPKLIAHDESPVFHHFVRPGVYLWERAPDAVKLWEDADGDMAVDVEWSSPDPRVKFSHARSLDTHVWVQGGEELLGARIPLRVKARDPNGTEISAEASMELGNRPPALENLSVTGPMMTGGGYSRFTVGFDVVDPDGDPLDVHIDFHPDEDVEPPFFLLREAPRGVYLDVFLHSFSVRLVVTATDPLGGRLEEVVRVEYEKEVVW